MKKYYLLLGVFIFSCSESQISNFDLKNSDDLKVKTNFSLANGYLLKYFSSFTYLGNNPSNVHRSYLNGMQGVANDGTHWFMSSKKKIYKWNGSYGFPSSLPTNHDQVGQVINSNYNHYGDLDYEEDQSLLYVPVEYNGKTSNPILMVFDSNLNYIDHQEMTNSSNNTKEAPWVSLDPTTKEIYTSKFSNVTELWIYQDSNSGNSLNINFARYLQLKKPDNSQLTLNRIQGGEFSKSGHLFLYAENSGGNNAGIYVIDILTGKQVNFKKVEIDQNKSPWGKQEYEGITIWDLDNTSNNGGYYGQVHAMLYEDSYYGKKFWFKHYRMGSQSTEVITPKITGSTINNKPYLEWDDFGTGYSYKVYETNTSPDGGAAALIGTTSSNSFTVNTQLENSSITGVHYPIHYHIIARKNGLNSSTSNSAFFSYEYDPNSGSGCGPYIICPGEFE